ncbi:MAG TPA: AraC family transcriptional regulator [Burkholderiaceae bacterium]|nr:AraC family transcriptional regulator [Burkholderiaceae bacterium]
MAHSPPQDVARLDRLSALLTAVAPRVVMGQPLDAHPHSLRISLLATGGEAPHGMVAAHNQGAASSDVSVLVRLEGPAAPLLMREFVQPLALSLAQADATLRQAVQLLWTELTAPRCGQPAMLANAGNILFIGLLRQLVAHPQTRMGLFAGLGDPRMAKALVAMHTHPHQRWTLEALADHAGMSRTAFATQFKAALGIPPGKYLGQLRLLIAQRAVQAGKGLKGAAQAAGYQNASALSRALGRARQVADAAL